MNVLPGGFGTSETTTASGGLTSHSPVSTGLGFNIAEYVLSGSVTSPVPYVSRENAMHHDLNISHNAIVLQGSGSDSRSSNNGGSGSSSQFDSSSKLQNLTSADKTTTDIPR